MLKTFTPARRLHVPVMPSLGPLMEDIADLAGTMLLLDREHPLLKIWHPDAVFREAANTDAEARYGLPGASVEERRSHEGQLYLWNNIVTVLVAHIETLQKAAEEAHLLSCSDHRYQLPLFPLQ